MKCEEILPRIGALVDGEVNAREKTLLLEHVRACPKCIREYEAQKWVKRELAAVPRETASEFLKARVMADVRTKPAGTPSFVLRLSGAVAALVVLVALAVGVVGHVGGRQSAQPGIANVQYKSVSNEAQTPSADTDIFQFAMDTHSSAEAKFQTDSYVSSPDIHLVDETMSSH
jgi:anti-sigma factor (TIGR02949 family)